MKDYYDDKVRQREEVLNRRRARAAKALMPMIVKLAPGIKVEDLVKVVEKEL